MKINIAMALTSAVFLTAWVTGFVSVIFSSLSFTAPDHIVSGLLTSGLLFIAIIELLSVISLSGSVLFLLEARKTLPRWYLAVPLCIFLSIFVIVNFLVYSNEKSFLSDPISTVEVFWIIVLALLSPCSVLYFLASYGHDRATKVYLVISSAASLFSLFFLILVLMEISRWSSIETVLLPLVFYWAILMPAIGVCFLSQATMYGVENNKQES